MGFEPGQVWLPLRFSKPLPLGQLGYNLLKMVGVPGFEPGTCGIKIRCSTN